MMRWTMTRTDIAARLHAVLGLALFAALAVAVASPARAAAPAELRPVLLGGQQGPDGLAVGILLGYRPLTPAERALVTLTADGVPVTVFEDGSFVTAVSGTAVAFDVSVSGVSLGTWTLSVPHSVTPPHGVRLYPAMEPPWLVVTDGAQPVVLPPQYGVSVATVAARAGCSGLQPAATPLPGGGVSLDLADALAADGWCILDLGDASGMPVGTVVVVSPQGGASTGGIVYAGDGGTCAPWVVIASNPGGATLDVGGFPVVPVAGWLVAAGRSEGPLTATYGDGAPSAVALTDCAASGRTPLGMAHVGSTVPTLTADGVPVRLVVEVLSGTLPSPLAAAGTWAAGAGAPSTPVPWHGGGGALGDGDISVTPADYAAWTGALAWSFDGLSGQFLVPVWFPQSNAARPVLEATSSGLSWVSGPTQSPPIPAAQTQAAGGLLVPNLAGLAARAIVVMVDEQGHERAAGRVTTDGKWIFFEETAFGGWTLPFTPGNVVDIGHGIVLQPHQTSSQLKKLFEAALAKHGLHVHANVAFPAPSGGTIYRTCIVSPAFPVYFCFHPDSDPVTQRRPAYGLTSAKLVADGKGIYCPHERSAAGFGADARAHILCASGAIAGDTFELDYAKGLVVNFVVGGHPGPLAGQGPLPPNPTQPAPTYTTVRLDFPSFDLVDVKGTVAIRGDVVDDKASKLLFSANGKVVLHQSRAPYFHWPDCAREPLTIEMPATTAVVGRQGSVYVFPRPGGFLTEHYVPPQGGTNPAVHDTHVHVANVARLDPIPLVAVRALASGFGVAYGLEPATSLTAARPLGPTPEQPPRPTWVSSSDPNYAKGTAVNAYLGIDVVDPNVFTRADVRFDPSNIDPVTGGPMPTVSVDLASNAPGGYFGNGGFTGVLTKKPPAIKTKNCNFTLTVNHWSESFAGDRAFGSRSDGSLALAGDLHVTVDLTNIAPDACMPLALQLRHPGQRYVLHNYKTDFWLDDLALCQGTPPALGEAVLKGRLFLDPLGGKGPAEDGSLSPAATSLTELAAARLSFRADVKGTILDKGQPLSIRQSMWFDRRFAYELETLTFETSPQRLLLSGELTVPFYGATPLYMRLDLSKVDPSRSPAQAWVKDPDDRSKRAVKLSMDSSLPLPADQQRIDVQGSWGGIPLGFDDVPYHGASFHTTSDTHPPIDIAGLFKAHRNLEALAYDNVNISVGAAIRVTWPDDWRGWLALGPRLYKDICKAVKGGAKQAPPACQWYLEFNEWIADGWMGNLLKSLTAATSLTQAFVPALKAIPDAILRMDDVQKSIAQSWKVTVDALVAAAQKIKQGIDQHGNPAGYLPNVLRKCSDHPGNAALAQWKIFKQHWEAIHDGLDKYRQIQDFCSWTSNVAPALRTAMRVLSTAKHFTKELEAKFVKPLAEVKKLLDAAAVAAASADDSEMVAMIVPLGAQAVTQVQAAVELVGTAKKDKAKFMSCLVDTTKRLLRPTKPAALAKKCKYSLTTITSCLAEKDPTKKAKVCACANAMLARFRMFKKRYEAGKRGVHIVSKKCKNIVGNFATSAAAKAQMTPAQKKLRRDLGLSEDEPKAAVVVDEAMRSYFTLSDVMLDHVHEAVHAIGWFAKALDTIGTVLDTVLKYVDPVATTGASAVQEAVDFTRAVCNSAFKPYGTIFQSGMSSAMGTLDALYAAGPVAPEELCKRLSDAGFDAVKIRRLRYTLEGLADPARTKSWKKVEENFGKAIALRSLNSADRLLRFSRSTQYLRNLAQSVLKSVRKKVDAWGASWWTWMRRITGAFSDVAGGNVQYGSNLLTFGIDGRFEFEPSTVSALDGVLRRLSAEVTFSLDTSRVTKSKKNKKKEFIKLELKGGLVVERLSKSEAKACLASPPQSASEKNSALLDAQGYARISSIGGWPAMQFNGGALLEETTPGAAPAMKAWRGGVQIDGKLGLGKAVELRSPGLALAFGDYENYFAARAGLKVQQMDMEGAVFVGRFCSKRPIAKLDKNMGSALSNCGGLTGFYLRAAASVPVPLFTFGCPFTLNVGFGAKMGIFERRDGSGVNAVMQLDGRASGVAACLVGIAGSIGLGGGLVGDDWRMQGSTWAAGGIGFCSPESWTSLSNALTTSDLCLACGMGVGFCGSTAQGSGANPVIGCENPSLSANPPPPCGSSSSAIANLCSPPAP